MRLSAVHLFESSATTIINPTNMRGPMGAGIAKCFADRYPTLEKQYKTICRGGLKTGSLVLYAARELDYQIICFPTKYDWRNESNVVLIEQGLKTLIQYSSMLGSIGMPQIGCGLGGINWARDMRPRIQDFALKYPYDVYVYSGERRVPKQTPYPHHEEGMSWVLEGVL